MTIEPRLDNASLTRAHVALVQAEGEMRKAGRGECADALAYADLVILLVRNTLLIRRLQEEKSV